jgi:hypothetical protein
MKTHFYECKGQVSVRPPCTALAPSRWRTDYAISAMLPAAYGTGEEEVFRPNNGAIYVT